MSCFCPAKSSSWARVMLGCGVECTSDCALTPAPTSCAGVHIYVASMDPGPMVNTRMSRPATPRCFILLRQIWYCQSRRNCSKSHAFDTRLNAPPSFGDSLRRSWLAKTDNHEQGFFCRDPHTHPWCATNSPSSISAANCCKAAASCLRSNTKGSLILLPRPNLA